MRKLTTINKRMPLLLAVLAATVAAMVFLGKCSHERRPLFSNDFIPSGGDTLDVAIEFNQSCYGVRGDSVFGRDYKIMQDISRRHGVPVKYHPFVPLRHATDGLLAGDYDIVIASMPLTVELKDRFLMTDPVYLDREVLVQLTDTAGEPPVRTPLDLAGDTVWITEDSPFRSRLENLSREIGDTIYIRTQPDATAEHLVILTALGRIPRAVVPETVADKLMRRYPRLDKSVAVSFTQFQSWALHPSATALRDSLNRWLSEPKTTPLNSL